MIRKNQGIKQNKCQLVRTITRKSCYDYIKDRNSEVIDSLIRFKSIDFQSFGNINKNVL
jgi:hypothetical protein